MFGQRETSEQGLNLGIAQIGFAQAVRRLADIAFGGEEDKNIAAAFVVEFFYRLQDIVLHIAVGQRVAVANFYGITASGDIDNRRIIEMGGEFFRVDGGGGNDDF
ncbi:Uncharacterised protein [Brevundimonas vesicularis]|uniref:Uncharacterized protein n=1 Tax=Brevundimonas vesicularis TaxID=41276 RepID=A0A2X1BY53_BREVE|nr:Uncharacterised protein [Brevundimonas vesicularis]